MDIQEYKEANLKAFLYQSRYTGPEGLEPSQGRRLGTSLTLSLVEFGCYFSAFPPLPEPLLLKSEQRVAGADLESIIAIDLLEERLVTTYRPRTLLGTFATILWEQLLAIVRIATRPDVKESLELLADADMEEHWRSLAAFVDHLTTANSTWDQPLGTTERHLDLLTRLIDLQELVAMWTDLRERMPSEARHSEALAEVVDLQILRVPAESVEHHVRYFLDPLRSSGGPSPSGEGTFGSGLLEGLVKPMEDDFFGEAF